MNDLMTRRTLAHKLLVATRTIYRWEKKGLPVIRIGGVKRYDLAEVYKWIKLNNKYEEDIV